MPADRDDARPPTYSDELFGDPTPKPQGTVTPCDPVTEPGQHAADRATPRDGDAADCEIEHEREETRRRTKI